MVGKSAGACALPVEGGRTPAGMPKPRIRLSPLPNACWRWVCVYGKFYDGGGGLGESPADAYADWKRRAGFQ